MPNMCSESVKRTIFVSYSWDSEEHRRWVRELADALQAQHDIEVTLDQYDLYGGRDLMHFMDQALACERIVVVSTPGYVAKVANRRGGVGYESSIISAELATDQSQDKFIPIIRAGTDLPAFLRSKAYIDFREPRQNKDALHELIAAIRREGMARRPPKLPSRNYPPTLPLLEADNVALGTPLTSPPAAAQWYPSLQPYVQLMISWAGSPPHSEISFRLKNDSDDNIRAARLSIEIEPISPLVLRIGDVAVETDSSELWLHDAAAQSSDQQAARERAVQISHDLNQLLAGTADLNRSRRLNLTYTDADGVVRGGSIVLSYRRVRRRDANRLPLEMKTERLNIAGNRSDA